MKRIVLVLLSLSWIACSPPSSTDSREVLRVQWLQRMTDAERAYTERIYQCISEMNSLAYKPVNSGPVCRESCKLLERINTMAKTAPDYIENPQQYYLGESKICSENPAPPKNEKVGG